MAYDEHLADRVRAELDDETGVAERRMVGGLAFMVGGNMACGVRGDELMVRLPLDDAQAALAEPATRESEMGGRPMKGWILVGPPGLRADEDLRRWVARGVAHARSLPPKDGAVRG